MLTCEKLGATVNDEQSNPSDARRFSSKQTKKDYPFDFMYHAAPRSLRRSDRHAAAANFAQLLNHRLHLCDLSSLWIWTPKQSPGSAIQVKVIFHLFGQHKTFLLQWLLIQPRAWPTLCRDSSGPCSLLLYMTQLIQKSKSIYFLTFTRTSILHSKRNFPVYSILNRTAVKLARKKTLNSSIFQLFSTSLSAAWSTASSSLSDQA